MTHWTWQYEKTGYVNYLVIIIGQFSMDQTFCGRNAAGIFAQSVFDKRHIKNFQCTYWWNRQIILCAIMYIYVGLFCRKSGKTDKWL